MVVGNIVFDDEEKPVRKVLGPIIFDVFSHISVSLVSKIA